MSAVLNKFVTIDEFAAFPEPADGSKEELLRGEVIVRPPPQNAHGWIQLQIGFLLKLFVKPKKLGWVMTETGFILERDPDTLLGPDVVYWNIRDQSVRPVKYSEVAPDLVVEVLSPDDRKKAIREKIKAYVRCGVKLVWVVDPEVRTTTVYAGSMQGTEFDENGTLSGGDVLPGFSCKVAEFFE